MPKGAVALRALRIGQIGQRAPTRDEGVDEPAAHRSGGGLQLNQRNRAGGFGILELVDGLGTTTQSRGQLTLT